MRWIDVTLDPNSAEAHAFRQRTLESARCPPVVSREDYLVEMARGKKVLDVGVVEHLAAASRKESWLHRKICESAATCLGIDSLAAEIELLKAEGYNVRYADFTKDPIEGAFDVIICGEVIEHLDDPGAIFRAAKRLLMPDGVIAVTTPNPFFLPRVRAQVMGRLTEESVDHATLLGPSNIAELAERAGMRLRKYRGVIMGKQDVRSMIGKMTMALKPLLTRVLLDEDALCRTIIYECSER
jgi:2-polyprenyl-3-methyl-5-hydroxy-6-metoxy-1,4-benzoquinol methylase